MNRNAFIAILILVIVFLVIFKVFGFIIGLIVRYWYVSLPLAIYWFFFHESKTVKKKETNENGLDPSKEIKTKATFEKKEEEEK